MATKVFERSQRDGTDMRFDETRTSASAGPNVQNLQDLPEDETLLFPGQAKTSETTWDTMYAVAEKYYQETGSLDPLQGYVTEEGYALGAWLDAQRRIRAGRINGSLTETQIRKLERIGMRWGVYDYVFERNYRAAAAYFQAHGNLECPAGHITSDGIRLGTWLRYLRMQYKKNPSFLTDEQYRMMNAVGMRWGHKYDLQWDEAYSELCEYYRCHKNIEVPVAYKTKSGVLLGRWIRRQIEAYTKGRLRADRIERLEQIGIVWHPVDVWEEKFLLAKAYCEAHHDLSSMPEDYTVNGIWLTKWLKEQKQIGEGRRKKQLTPEQREKLASIGISFGTSDAAEVKGHAGDQ